MLYEAQTNMLCILQQATSPGTCSMTQWENKRVDEMSFCETLGLGGTPSRLDEELINS